MADDILPDEPPVSNAQVYQDARMAAMPAVYRTTHERLACELAMQMEEPDAVFARYGYTEEQGIALLEQPAFAALIDRIGREVRESGLSFKTKAKMQAEELLGHSFQIATDPLTSSAVRADLIKWTAKMAGYEPKEKDAGSGGGGLTLSITFAGQQPQTVVSHEPLTIEQQGG